MDAINRLITGERMAKYLLLVFLSLLVYAHLQDVDGAVFHRPLSEFRDFQPKWIGYALFGVLLAIGAETIRCARQYRAALDTTIFAVVTALLTVVSFTVSYGELHNICALAVMGTMYWYYATLLYQETLYPHFALHVAMPVLLLLVTRAESYGSWQKGMILYFLMANTVQQWAGTRWLRRLKLQWMQLVFLWIGMLWLPISKLPWINELVEGIEWANRPPTNPDIPVHMLRRHGR